MSNDLFNLEGKVALVTGGNGGIGLGMAEGMAKAGANIAIWGTNETKNADAVEQIRSLGVKVASFQCNVADQDQVNDAFAQTLDTFGRIDGCYANAGVSGRAGSFLEITKEEWHRVLSVNLDGVFFTYQAMVKHVLDRAKNGDPGGRLVGISSLASRSGAARNEHYAATKGALNAMTYALAVEYARYGVTANTILPGWIETDMTSDYMSDERFTKAVKPRIPARRFGKPDDFAGIAVYLMSDASAYHTGECIMLDGGYWRF